VAEGFGVPKTSLCWLKIYHARRGAIRAVGGASRGLCDTVQSESRVKAFRAPVSRSVGRSVPDCFSVDSSDCAAIYTDNESVRRPRRREAYVSPFLDVLSDSRGVLLRKDRPL